MIIQLQECAAANKDHSKNIRAYCHVFHKKDKIIDNNIVHIICCAKAYWLLPKNYRKGLLYHEIGHILRPDIVDELEVDKVVLKPYGIKVIRRSGKYGDNLEWVK